MFAYQWLIYFNELHLLHTETLNLRCDVSSVRSTSLQDAASAWACEKISLEAKVAHERLTTRTHGEHLYYIPGKATEILKALFVEAMLFCSVKLTTSTEI